MPYPAKQVADRKLVDDVPVGAPLPPGITGDGMAITASFCRLKDTEGSPFRCKKEVWKTKGFAICRTLFAPPKNGFHASYLPYLRH